VASVLSLVVDVFVGLTLALRPRDTTTSVALVAALVAGILLALGNSFVAAVRNMPFLLL
jgi:uncharacterized membrane protein YczE